MSQTNTPTNPAIVHAGPVPAPRGPRERRVRFGHLALAIALIVVGALGTATLVLSVTADGTYLVAAREIPYGKQFTQDDLMTVRLNNSPDVNAVAASSIEQVIGNYNAYSLPAGALLTDDHVIDDQFPAAGQVLVGITLSADRLPSFDVRAGDAVRLVDTSELEAAADQEAPAPTPQSWQATVVGFEGADGGSLLGGGSDEFIVDVVVAEQDAATIARLAADDSLYLALLPGQ